MTRQKKKPLDVRYNDALQAPTPAQGQLSEIAAVAGVAIATVRAWIAGKQQPTKQSLRLLSDYYQMPEDELFSPDLFSKAI